MEKQKILTIYEDCEPEAVFEEVKSIIMPIAKKVVGKAFELKSEEQLKLGELSSPGYTEEKDGKVYPMCKLDVRICEENGTKYRNVIIVVTPFNCYYYGYRIEFSEEGKSIPEVTKTYRKHMKKKYGAEYSSVVISYAYKVNTINGLKI